MSIQVQHRRDTRAVIMGVVPAVGELGYSTDTKEVTLGDGTTPGGAWVQRKNQLEPLAVSGLTGAINNWAPAGYSLHTGALNLTATGACTITGLTGGVSGRVLKLYNTGSNPITLQGNNAGSAAQNRFSFLDLTLHPNACAHLLYDATASLWFCLSLFDGSAGLLAANNLSDVASVATSRINLGLGTAATQNTGTSGATVPLLSTDNTWSGAQSFAGPLYNTSALTPPTLNTDTNDWAPAGFATANTIRMSSSVPVNLTGLAGGTSGRRVTLVNVGTQNITLVRASAASLAANRFNLATNMTLVPAQAIALWYDAVASSWDGLATTSASASGGLLSSNNLSDVASAPTSRTNLGLGSLATQNASTATITGGTIDGTALGTFAPAAGSFTTLLLAADPTLALQATTKQYVDSRVGTIKLGGAFVSHVAGLVANLSGGYSTYRLVVRHIEPDTDAFNLQLLCSVDGGTSYFTGSSAYNYVHMTQVNGVSTVNSGSSGTDSFSSAILLTHLGQQLAQGASTLVVVDIDPGGSGYLSAFSFRSVYYKTGGGLLAVSTGGGQLGTTSRVTNVKLQYNSPCLLYNATYELYGML